jgi:hypothetical protein
VTAFPNQLFVVRRAPRGDPAPTCLISAPPQRGADVRGSRSRRAFRRLRTQISAREHAGGGRSGAVGAALVPAGARRSCEAQTAQHFEPLQPTADRRWRCRRDSFASRRSPLLGEPHLLPSRSPARGRNSQERASAREGPQGRSDQPVFARRVAPSSTNRLARLSQQIGRTRRYRRMLWRLPGTSSADLMNSARGHPLPGVTIACAPFGSRSTRRRRPRKSSLKLTRKRHQALHW